MRRIAQMLCIAAALWLAADAAEARFLQTDPVKYQDDLNPYTYVRNDPLNLGDPSGREIKIETDDFFYWVEVMTDLAIIASKPEGQALIEELASSEHVVVIREGAPNSTYATDPEGATNREGSGSIVTYDLGQTRGNRDVEGNAERPSFVGLVHEFGHARRNIRGEEDFSGEGQGRAGAEAYAVGVENAVRTEHGLPLVPVPATERSDDERAPR